MVEIEEKRRVRGFDAPLSCNQILSWIGNVVVTGGNYILCLVFLFGKKHGCSGTLIAILLLPHIFFVFFGFVSWLFLETHPPSLPSIFGQCLPDTPRWNKRRYCREHREIILGLDHFCTWLNTAIGRENYIPFYILALFGVLQYTMHIIISITILVTCNSIGLVFQCLFSIFAFFAALILCAYSALFIFHTYLIILGIGTYDWILNQQLPHSTNSTHDRIPTLSSQRVEEGSSSSHQ
mmetsp:Transcript_16602/g.21619  ORF Transcript_16602/g.21619 Transcript_16602/m.21619 type:complete len:237 (+) Transcript_16602:37-747(+)